MAIKLLDTLKSFQAKVLKETKSVISKIFRSRSSTMNTQAKAIIAKALVSSPTIQSLLGGKLQADFGLTDAMANQATSEIISTIVNNTNLQFDTKDPNLVGTITVAISADANTSIVELLTSNVGIYINDGPKGGEIDWLIWLLTEGTQVVIGGYHVEYGIFPNSRSQMAVMREGDAFRVDSEHSGTIDDNFITRAISLASVEIIEMIKRELQR